MVTTRGSAADAAAGAGAGGESAGGETAESREAEAVRVARRRAIKGVKGSVNASSNRAIHLDAACAANCEEGYTKNVGAAAREEGDYAWLPG